MLMAYSFDRMNKNIVYLIEYGVGKVKVCSTRYGDGYAARMAGNWPVKILERLESPSELFGLVTKHLARYIREDYIVLNSKAQQSLARKLWLGVTRNHPGNISTLNRNGKTKIDELTGLPIRHQGS